MAIQYITNEYKSSATSVTFFKPTSVPTKAGVFAILMAETFESTEPVLNISGGFIVTKIETVTVDTTSLHTWWIRLDGTYTNSIVVNSPGDHIIAHIRWFDGVKKTGNPIYNYSTLTTDVATNSIPIPFVEAPETLKNYLYLGLTSLEIDTTNQYYNTHTADVYQSLSSLVSTSLGNGGGIGYITGYVPDGGSLGPGVEFKIFGNSKSAAIAIIVEPEPEVGYPIAFKGSKTATAATLSTTFSWLPHNVGDVAILAVSCATNESVIQAPNDFQRLGSTIIKMSSDETTILNRLDIFWCRAHTNRMPDIVLEGNNVLNVSAMLLFGGCRKTGNPFQEYNMQLSPYDSTSYPLSNGINAPVITTSFENSLVLFFTSVNYTTALESFKDIVNTNLNYVNRLVTNYRTNSPGANLGIGSGVKVLPGDIGQTRIGTYATTPHLTASVALVPEIESAIENRNGSILDQVGLTEQLTLLKNGVSELNDTIGSRLELINFKSIGNILYSDLGINLSNSSLKKTTSGINKSFKLTDEVNSSKAILNQIIDSLGIEKNSFGIKKGIKTINIQHGDNSFATYIVTIREDKYGNVILRAGQDLNTESLVSKQIDIYIENQEENLIFQTFYDKQINLHIENGGNTYADGTIYEVINLIYLLKLKGLLIKKQTSRGQFEKTTKLNGVLNKKRRLICYVTDRTGN